MNKSKITSRPVTKASKPEASIIIPAYNEESVILRCLESFLGEADTGEFDVIVVCNGCTDNTEAVAREFGNSVRVFNIKQPSKADALNLGDRVALAYPRVYMDGDLEVSTEAVRALITAVKYEKPAAIGYMDVDLRDRNFLVSSFYRLWMLHPYLRAGKFGGIYALSKEGCEHRGGYPNVMGDDAFVKNCFTPDQYTAVPSCRFRVFPPCTLLDVLRVRTRVFLGNYQLKKVDNNTPARNRTGLLDWGKSIAQNPKVWPGIPVYIILNTVARLNALRLYRRSNFRWLRDDSSRIRAH